MNYKKIALVGMMGSGKSAISSILAARIGIEKYEADEIFEQQNSIKIKDFFKTFGEDEFRKKETQILKQILNYDEFVLSCGGGVILKEENRELLFNTDVLTIYLKAKADTIYNRIKHDKNRPLLLVENPKKEIEKILSLRESFYELAKITITTDDKNLNEIVEKILKEAENYGKN